MLIPLQRAFRAISEQDVAAVKALTTHALTSVVEMRYLHMHKRQRVQVIVQHLLTMGQAATLTRQM